MFQRLFDLANLNKSKSEPLVMFLQPAPSIGFYISSKGSRTLPGAQAKKTLELPLISVSLKPYF